MRGEFFGSIWQFGRNMIVVREADRLTLINSVRLNDEGLAYLDKLGRVVNVVRIGSMHGMDDPFYVNRYHAAYWTLPDMKHKDLPTDKELKVGGEMPFKGCSLFVFQTTKLPEAILRVDREGGILIACDALQNWAEPDHFCDPATIEKMRPMGFFTPANLGVAWQHATEPKKADFERLKEVKFAHVLCGHGTPVKNTAKEAYHATFDAKFP
jgi:hypothetical protein